MADVFVSYRHSDHELVAPIAEGLELRDLDVWFDRSDILSGERWRERITEGIAQAGAVVVAVGPDGIGGVQAFEVDLALDRSVLDVELPIIPVLLPGARLDGAQWTQLATRSYVEMDGATDDDVVDRIANGIRGLGVEHPKPPEDTDREPYPGLRPFTTDEEDLYFGREADIDALVELCRSPGLTAVLGPSGSGKSSLVRAGLIPRLQTTSIASLRHWRPVVVDPGPEPARSFLVGLAALGPSPLGLPLHAVEQTQHDTGVFSSAVLAVLSGLDERTGLLVVVDQLEQLFTRGQDEASRKAFGDNLSALAAHCPDRARVVVTLRSDYLDQLAELPALARAIGARHHLLAPIDGDGLRDVIQQPAWHCGIALEPRLVDEIALDVENQPNALPLLSVALQEMWHKRQGDRLTLKAYVEGGRVTGALAELAEASIRPLLPDQEPLVRSTLLRLVAFPPGAPAVRRKRRAEDLAGHGGDRQAVLDLLGGLTESRLLVGDQDGVEFADDAVLNTWPRLHDWVLTARADEEARQRVEGANGRVVGVRPVRRPPGHGGDGRRAHTAGRERAAPAHRHGAGVPARELAPAAAGEATPLDGRGDGRRGGGGRRSGRRAVAPDERPGRQEPGCGRPRTGRAVDPGGLRPAGPRPPAGDHGLRPVPAPGGAFRAGDDAHAAGAARRDVGAHGRHDHRRGRRAGRERGARRHDGRRAAGLRQRATDLCRQARIAATRRARRHHGGRRLHRRRHGRGHIAGRPGGRPADRAPSNEPVRLANLDQQGQLIVDATEGGVVEVRNLGSGGFALGQVTGTPSAVAVSARRGLALGAGSQRFGFTLWDIGDGAMVADVSSGDVLGIVYAAAFDESGDRLVVSDGSTGDLLVWSVDALVNGTDERPLRLPGGDRAVLGLAVTGDRVVAVDEGGVVRQFNLANGRPTGAPMTALAPLGERPATMIAAGARDGDGRIVAVRTDGVVEWDGLGRSGLNQGHTDIEALAVVAATPADDQIFAVSADGALHTLDGDGAVVTTVEGGAAEPTSALVLAPDRVAVGGRGLAVVDPRTGERLAERTDLDVVALARAGGSDAGVLAAATSDGGVVLLDPGDLSTVEGPVQATGDPIHRPGPSRPTPAPSPSARPVDARGTSSRSTSRATRCERWRGTAPR